MQIVKSGSREKTSNRNIFSNLSRISIYLLLIAVAALTGCRSSASSVQSDEAEYDLYRKAVAQSGKSNVGALDVAGNRINDVIKPGDQIQIMVWGYPEFNTTTTVKDYGTVTIPLIGDVMAAGMDQAEFTKAIKEQLSEYVKGEPKLTISHIEMDKRVSVMGAVNKQDNYTVLYDEQLIELIAAAGGPATDADLRHVKIFRNSKTNNVIDVDLTKHLEDGDMETVPKVRPGDTVFIPTEENLMRDISDYARDIILLFGFFRLLY